MSISLGLSFQKNDGENKPCSREKLRMEARRVLSLMDTDRGILSDSGGRPYYADQHAVFSISHSHNAAAVAVLPDRACRAGSGIKRFYSPEQGLRIGCDIQYADPDKAHAGISRAFFQSGEQEYILKADAARQYCRFYRIWVLKEAWLKMRGLSVFDMAQAPAFYPEPLPKDRADFRLYELVSASGELYMLALVWEPDDLTGEPQIQWFSQDRLAISGIQADSF